jgi:RNA polymerase sigma-70 factor (ECF subfamily)
MDPARDAPWVLTEAVREALVRLPRRQREVVVLRHLEGLSYETIAGMLRMAPATARVHAKAALENLRERVAKHLDERVDR